MGDSTEHSNKSLVASLIQSPYGQESEQAPSVEPFDSGLARILVVDDDPSFGKIMSRIGQQSQVSMTVCKSLEEIGDLEHQKFDAAIVDYDLGSTNGIQVAEHLENLLGDIPVILVSQSQLVETPISLWPSNVKGFLHKALGHIAILEAALAAHDIACTVNNGTNIK
jgi:CheY-like chemotaxis protein